MTRVLTFLFIGTLLFACGTSKNKKEEAQVEKVLVGTPLWDELEMEVIAEPTEYRATETVHTDLIHTKLEVNFNWDESQMNGKATITAKPHFYPSDSIVLDAKGMDILKVQMAGKDLTYIYAEDFLRIKFIIERLVASVVSSHIKRFKFHVFKNFSLKKSFVWACKKSWKINE